jgi:hypothetical protein
MKLFKPYQQCLVRGKDGKPHNMSIVRKSGPGIGTFSDIRRANTVDQWSYMRQRAKMFVRGAVHRAWVLSNPYTAIRKLIIN